MKKNWIRLLSVLLTAVMIFPATAFAAGEAVSLYTGDTYTIELPAELADVEVNWRSMQEDIVSVSGGKVTALKAGDAVVKLYNAEWAELDSYAFVVTDPVPASIEVTPPTKLTYYSGEALNLAGLSVNVRYNNNKVVPATTGYSVQPAEQTLNTRNLSAGRHVINVTYGELTPATFTITVEERKPISIEVVDTKTKYDAGDSFLGVEVRVNYNDGTHDILVSGYTVSPETAVKGTTSYTITYRGLTATKTGISVTESGSGGGSGSGGSGTTTAEYTLSVYSGPTKKTYSVGDTFDTSGLYLTVKDKNGAQVTTLYGTNLQIWPYTFKDTDLPTGTATTSTITVDVLYNEKIYPVKISGLTVTPAKKKLDVRTTTGNMIYSMTVELKKTRYPVGTTLSLADISRIYGLDKDGNPFALAYEDLAGYTNTFSLEVASINSRGETTRKSTTSTYKSTIMADDVYTASNGNKVAYIRLYIDSYYTEFEVDSGESPVSVYSSSAYTSSSLLGMYEELADALADVNDVKHLWGSTATSTQAASRTLYIRLNQDDILGRYDYMTPARNIEIDLNGHKLTMYSETFRFLDKADSYAVTLINKASETAKIVYTDLDNVDDLLLDKNEALVYKFQDRSTAVVPGVYTITLSELKYGTVTAKPAVSNKGTITVAHGNDVTFTITPDKDYQIDAVKQKLGTSSETTVNTNTNNGYSLNSQTGVATYTLKDVQKDATFTVTFKAVKKEEPPKQEETPKPAEWTNPFTDVNTYASYYEAVKYVNQNGLMNGMTASSFGPNQTMTRAQFVTTLGRMYLGSIFQTTAEKDAAMIRQYGTDSQFSDVSYTDASLSYAVPYIKWAESSGLVLGYGNGKFGPKDTITHQQMYIIMYRYAQLEGKSINVNTVSLRASDANKIGENWAASAKESAVAAAKYGQQQGFLVNSTLIDPAGNALRYELAILLRQFSVNVLGRQ